MGNLDETRQDETRRAPRASPDAASDDPVPLVEAFLASRRASVPAGSKSHTTLVQLIDSHGPKAVIEAMERLPAPLHDGAQYIYGARNALRPIPRSNGTQASTAAPDNRGVEDTKRLLAEYAAIEVPDRPTDELMTEPLAFRGGR